MPSDKYWRNSSKRVERVRHMRERDEIERQRGVSDLLFFGPTPLAIISHQLCYIAFDLLLVCCYRVLTLHRNWENLVRDERVCVTSWCRCAAVALAPLLQWPLYNCDSVFGLRYSGPTWLVNQSGQFAPFCPSHLHYCHPSLYLACKMSKYISVKFMVIDQKRPTGLTLHNYAGSYALQSRGISASACVCVHVCRCERVCVCACVYVAHSVFAYFGDLHVSYHTDPHPLRVSVSV